MATITSYGPIRHLRAEPNHHILHFRRGELVREGTGLAFWFSPLSTAIAQVPAEDCETTISLRERSADFQETNVHITLRYRFRDPVRAARRFNFTISLDSGGWVEEPIERLATFWIQRMQPPAREYIASVPLVEVLTSGPTVMRRAITEKVREDPEVEEMGLLLVGVQVNRAAPSAELEKALQTPTREALQERADEAMFRRRALAVENERAIKENELQTEIELAERQEELIRREGGNRLLDVRQQSEAERERVEAELELKSLSARSDAEQSRVRAEGAAAAERLVATARADGEARRLEVWADATPAVHLGLALQEFAGKIEHIQHLNLTPSVLGDAFQQFLTGEAER